MPYQQHPNFSTALTLVLRTAGDPLQAANATQQIVRGMNPDVPVVWYAIDRASWYLSTGRSR